jgi:hypothetical protein
MRFRLEAGAIELIKRIVDSPDAQFNALVKLAKLTPQRDFEFQDLSGLDFGDADLRGFSFRGSDLSYSNLESCNIDSSTIFLESKLTNTKLPPKLREYYGKMNATVIVIVSRTSPPAREIAEQISAMAAERSFLTTFVGNTEAIVRTLLGGKTTEKNERDIFIVDCEIENIERITIGLRELVFVLRNEYNLDRMTYIGSSETSRQIIRGQLHARGFVGQLTHDVGPELKREMIVDTIFKNHLGAGFV